jgi:hypothetical protein
MGSYCCFDNDGKSVMELRQEVIRGGRHITCAPTSRDHNRCRRHGMRSMADRSARIRDLCGSLSNKHSAFQYRLVRHHQLFDALRSRYFSRSRATGLATFNHTGNHLGGYLICGGIFRYRSDLRPIKDIGIACDWGFHTTSFNRAACPSRSLALRLLGAWLSYGLQVVSTPVFVPAVVWPAPDSVLGVVFVAAPRPQTRLLLSEGFKSLSAAR